MWTELCQKNMNHYNQHPTQHNLITAVYGVTAVAVLSVTSRWIARDRKTV